MRGITRNPTNVLIQVEDGTGTIEVRKWIESSDGETEGLDPETGIQFSFSPFFFALIYETESFV